MGIVPAKHLPPVASDEMFEELSLHVWRRLLSDPATMRYGRSGQKQHGIDLLGRRNCSDKWVGIQCKARRSGTLGQKDIQGDLNAALGFNPKLSEYVIATTARRDSLLQSFASQQTAQNIGVGAFSVETFFWDDFEEFLFREENIDLLQRYYGEFLIEASPTRIAVARMFTLRVGVGIPQTKYELMIGKTLRALPDEDASYDVAYFKNIAFIVDLNARRADFFRLPCGHHSDIMMAIGNETDQYIIAKWINSFESIDALVRSPSDAATFCISADEASALHRSTDDE